jgi:hypothetical protein
MPAEEIKRFQEKAIQTKEMIEELIKISNDIAKIKAIQTKKMQEKLIKISHYVDRIAAYANKNGFTLTQQELRSTIDQNIINRNTIDENTIDENTIDENTIDENTIDEKKASETDGALNEEDLEKVAGGITKNITPFLF